jgi:hypothetical protein
MSMGCSCFNANGGSYGAVNSSAGQPPGISSGKLVLVDEILHVIGQFRNMFWSRQPWHVPQAYCLFDHEKWLLLPPDRA